MTKFRNLALKIVTFTAATTTAGTNVNVAHGLPYTPNTQAILVQPYCTSASTTDDVNSWAVVSSDTTNVVIRPSRTLAVPTKGRVFIFLDTHDSAPNEAR